MKVDGILARNIGFEGEDFGVHEETRRIISVLSFCLAGVPLCDKEIQGGYNAVLLCRCGTS